MKKFLLMLMVVSIGVWVTNDASAQNKDGKDGERKNRAGQRDGAERPADGQNRRGKAGQDGKRGPRGEGQKRGPQGQGADGQRRNGQGKDGQGKDGQGADGKRPGGAEMVERLFAQLDKNKDGAIAGDEVPERMKQRFTELDANSDGKCDKKEFAAAMKRRMQAQGQGGPGAGKGPRGDGMGKGDAQGKGPRGDGKGNGEKGKGQDRQAGQRPTAEMMLGRLDKDSDGKISKSEAPERMQQHFAQIDANGDNFVDSAELATMMKQMGQRNGQNPGGKGPRGEKDGANKDGQKPKRPAGK